MRKSSENQLIVQCMPNIDENEVENWEKLAKVATTQMKIYAFASAFEGFCFLVKKEKLFVFCRF